MTGTVLGATGGPAKPDAAVARRVGQGRAAAHSGRSAPTSCGETVPATCAATRNAQSSYQ